MADLDKQAALFAALAKAQGEFAPVTRDREVEVTMKAGGKYTFSYATLAGAIEITRPVLAENGLAVAQLLTSTSDGRPAIETMILHADGGSITGLIPIKTDGLDPQGVGSLVTYTRRYAYFGALGIAPVDDDDARTATKQHHEQKAKNEKKAPVSLVQEVEQLIADLNESGALGEVEIREAMTKQYGTSVTAGLTVAQASNLKTRLSQKVPVPA